MAWMLYIINWICAALMASAFIKSKKNVLASRDMMIQMLLALAWYQLWWGVIFFIDANIVLGWPMWYVINLPFTITLTRLSIYVIKHYIFEYE